MSALIFYLFLALFVSFICSLTESVLLSTPKTYLTTIKEKEKVGKFIFKNLNQILMNPYWLFYH